MDNLPLLNKFLSYLRKKNYSEETVYNYERDLRTFGTFLKDKNIRFQEIDNNIINDYKSYLVSTGRKTMRGKEGIKVLNRFSINRMLSALRAYSKYLINIG